MKRSTLLKVDEVANLLKVSRGHIYNLVSQRKLPAIHIFGALRFDPDDIQRVIDQGRTHVSERGEGSEEKIIRGEAAGG